MKIIVTGCRGQLGTEIIKQLREGRSELGPIPEKLVSATVIPVDLPELDITNYKMVGFDLHPPSAPGRHHQLRRFHQRGRLRGEP